jgi:hypothetical protein
VNSSTGLLALTFVVLLGHPTSVGTLTGLVANNIDWMKRESRRHRRNRLSLTRRPSRLSIVFARQVDHFGAV